MLTSETKRKIDNLRDTLVGKLPVPTQQVEQITLALIYKFMSDIDEGNTGIGGKSFFNSEYKKYSWGHIMDRSLPGHERVALYAEGLEKMSLNRNLPQLFRDIFKGAYLPFKDPIVVDHFLKGVNELKYDHSEELGNAFEYLLSIMGSQGDAGQFRTPRHIIDFIVQAVNPQKEDKILDPACGTAGFLISAYKHILAQNTDPKTNRPGSLLSTTERRKLTKNFVGYDISHEMVRLSLVNMYLHNFPEPKIYEYDTLSNLDRWDDDFDCILANPPFMTPRGGILPHNRFVVQARRSEVLFVDYIMEHLTTNGKAGVIVPEGIIFQSGTAYKALRKMLVDDGYLFAVVSLPAGVFQPYSGVKTSILLMDKVLAKKNSEILFVKVENDGFDLGAQRRPIDKNDLPKALEIIKKYKEALRGGKTLKLNGAEEKYALIVPKEKIAESGDYNLSADRYRVATDYTNAKWSMVELGELEKEEKVEFLRGQGLSKSDLTEEGKNKCIHYGEIYTLYDPVIKYVVSKTNFDGKITSLKGDVLVPATTTADAMGIAVARSLNEHGVIIGGDINIIRTRNKFVLSDYLALLISNSPLKNELARSAKGANILHLSNSDLKRLKIPLPSLEIQQQIVAELDGYQKIIDGAKQIVANYRPTIKIDPSWKVIELGNLFLETRLGLVKDKSKQSENYPHPYIKMDSITTDGYLDLNNITNVEATKEELEKYTLDNGDFIYNTRNAPNLVGKSTVYHGENRKYLFNNNILRIRFKKDADPDFINYYLNTAEGKNKIKTLVSGTTSVAAIYQKNFATITIPFPPTNVQKYIVNEIAKERECIHSALKTISIFEERVVRLIDNLL